MIEEMTNEYIKTDLNRANEVIKACKDNYKQSIRQVLPRIVIFLIGVAILSWLKDNPFDWDDKAMEIVDLTMTLLVGVVCLYFGAWAMFTTTIGNIERWANERRDGIMLGEVNE